MVMRLMAVYQTRNEILGDFSHCSFSSQLHTRKNKISVLVLNNQLITSRKTSQMKLRGQHNLGGHPLAPLAMCLEIGPIQAAMTECSLFVSFGKKNHNAINMHKRTDNYPSSSVQ